MFSHVNLISNSKICCVLCCVHVDVHTEACICAWVASFRGVAPEAQWEPKD